MGTGERVDQRGLSGTVAADERDDLTRVQVDRDAVDGVEATEGHPDVAQLDERNAPRLRRWRCGGRIGHGAAS